VLYGACRGFGNAEEYKKPPVTRLGCKVDIDCHIIPIWLQAAALTQTRVPDPRLSGAGSAAGSSLNIRHFNNCCQSHSRSLVGVFKPRAGSQGVPARSSIPVLHPNHSSHETARGKEKSVSGNEDRNGGYKFYYYKTKGTQPLCHECAQRRKCPSVTSKNSGSCGSRTFGGDLEA
jgi:hypothetical protein